MSANKPSNEEEKYFAKEEAATRHRLAVEHMAKLEKEAKETLRALHHMKCPKCGFDLEHVNFRDVGIDRCFHCHGTFLEAGDLERLAGSEHGFLQSILSSFHPKSG